LTSPPPKEEKQLLLFSLAVTAIKNKKKHLMPFKKAISARQQRACACQKHYEAGSSVEDGA
jgi:hypothetical protein